MRKKTQLTLVFLLIVVFCLLFKQKGHWWGDDFALYINQARSICTGSIDSLIELNKFSIEQSTIHNFSPVLAPWGFPILLCPIYYFRGLDIEAFKYLTILSLVFFLFFYYLLFKKRVPFSSILLIILLIGVNIKYLNHINAVQTEFPYLFFSFLTLYFIQSYLRRYSLGTGIALGILIYFSFSIRTEGILLVSTLALVQFAYFVKGFKKIQGQRFNPIKQLHFLTPYISFVVLYVVASLILPNSFLTHTDNSSMISLSRVAKSVDFYSQAVFQLLGFKNNIFTLILVTVTFFAGIVFRVSKDIILVIYLIQLVFVYLLWPFNEFRYILGIFPFVLYFIVQGLFILIKKVTRQRIAVYSLNTFLLILLFFSGIKTVGFLKQIDRNKYIYGSEMPDSRDLFSFIKSNTNEDDTVIFFRPRAMTLYTQRKSAMIFDSINSVIDNGNYFAVNKTPGTICQIKNVVFLAESNEVSPFLKNIYENSNFILYKIIK